MTDSADDFAKKLNKALTQEDEAYERILDIVPAFLKDKIVLPVRDALDGLLAMPENLRTKYIREIVEVSVKYRAPPKVEDLGGDTKQ